MTTPLPQAYLLNTPSDNVDIIDVGAGDAVPVSLLLAHMLLQGIVIDATDPDNFSATMEAFSTQATLTVPVLKGPQGLPGTTAIPLRFQDRVLPEPNQLPTDLGDTEADIGCYWVFPVIDDSTGDAIATTIYVWTGTAGGFVQLPVGSPGPDGPYANLEVTLDLHAVDLFNGPGGVDNWVDVNAVDPYTPRMTFNLAQPQGNVGPAAALGAYRNVDFRARQPQIGDMVQCSDRVTPGPPTGLVATEVVYRVAWWEFWEWFKDPPAPVFEPGSTFYYGITATLPNGETTVSNIASVTVGDTNIGIQLTWDGDPNPSGYRVYRGTAADKLDELVGVVVANTGQFGDVNNPTLAGSPPTESSFTAGTPLWVSAALPPSSPLLYTVPQSAFLKSDLKIEFLAINNQVPICQFDVPPQPFPWIPVVFGTVKALSIELSLHPFVSACAVFMGSSSRLLGRTVAYGTANLDGVMTIVPDVTPWRMTAPDYEGFVIPPNHTGNQGTLYVNLVSFDTTLWSLYTFSNQDAALAVLVVPVDVYDGKHWHVPPTWLGEW